MTTRKCAHCGAEFALLAKRGRPRLSCDADCADAVRQERARARYDAARQLGASAEVAGRCAQSPRALDALRALSGQQRLSDGSDDGTERTAGDCEPPVAG
jgi:hypothetical protein